MTQRVEAIYENGVLRPLQPLQLKESEVVHLEVSPESTASEDDLIDDVMLAYARQRIASLDHVPSIEEVRESFSKVEGSMSEAVLAERGEY